VSVTRVAWRRGLAAEPERVPPGASGSGAANGRHTAGARRGNCALRNICGNRTGLSGASGSGAANGRHTVGVRQGNCARCEIFAGTAQARSGGSLAGINPASRCAVAAAIVRMHGGNCRGG